MNGQLKPNDEQQNCTRDEKKYSGRPESLLQSSDKAAKSESRMKSVLTGYGDDSLCLGMACSDALSTGLDHLSQLSSDLSPVSAGDLLRPLPRFVSESDDSEIEGGNVSHFSDHASSFKPFEATAWSASSVANLEPENIANHPYNSESGLSRQLSTGSRFSAISSASSREAGETYETLKTVDIAELQKFESVGEIPDLVAALRKAVLNDRPIGNLVNVISERASSASSIEGINSYKCSKYQFADRRLLPSLLKNSPRIASQPSSLENHDLSDLGEALEVMQSTIGNSSEDVSRVHPYIFDDMHERHNEIIYHGSAKLCNRSESTSSDRNHKKYNLRPADPAGQSRAGSISEVSYIRSKPFEIHRGTTVLTVGSTTDLSHLEALYIDLLRTQRKSLHVVAGDRPWINGVSSSITKSCSRNAIDALRQILFPCKSNYMTGRGKTKTSYTNY